jgi:oxygen-dependent protoporphyrinogen oxidase
VSPRVVVAGGGVAGLTVAVDLARAGADVTVLEASARVGGCLAPVTPDGLPEGLALDAGAESFATRTTAVADLLADVGLAGDVVAPERLGAWVHHAGGPVPLPAAGLLGVPVDAWAADVRRAVGVLGAARAWLDRVLPAGVGVPDGPLTVADLVRARMGRRVLERLVGPVVSGVHSCPPRDLDVDTAMPGVRQGIAETGSLAGAVARLRERSPAGSAVAGLRGGMHRLPPALAADLARHGGQVRTGVEATTVRAEPDGTWSVVASDGVHHADHVVVAVPGAAAARLLGPWATPPTPPAVPVTVVTLVLDAPELDAAPRGTGVLVAPGTGVVAKGLTHSTAKWAWLATSVPGRHVVRLSYGRGGTRPAPELMTVLTDASVVLGARLTHRNLVGWARSNWPTGLGAPPAGHRDRVLELRRDLPRGLWVTGAWVAGTGLAAVVADARATAATIGDAIGAGGP